MVKSLTGGQAGFLARRRSSPAATAARPCRCDRLCARRRRCSHCLSR
jgi:hypothetical protein